MRVRHATLTLLGSYVVTAWAAAAVTAAAVVYLAVDRGLAAAAAVLGPVLSLPVGIASGVLVGAILAALFAVVTLLAAAASFLGTRDLRCKLYALADASALFAAGRLTHRVDIPGGDDLAVTANQLNRMAQQLQNQVAALQEAAKQQTEREKNAELSATLRERERVRRELHDRVSQDLFGLSMLCAAAAAKRSSKPEQALALLPELEELAKRTQGSMRALLLELRPVALSERALSDALERLAQELAARTGLPIHVAIRDAREDPQKETLAAIIEDALFLIAQEALINALRHAHPQRIDIMLDIERERAVLRVVDDGEGFADMDATMTSVGLRSMAERATLLGGSCTIRNASPRGAEVIAIIPRVREES
ncbi:MAG: sensor histidine kinase [Bacilli bacterium]